MNADLSEQVRQNKPADDWGWDRELNERAADVVEAAERWAESEGNRSGNAGAGLIEALEKLRNHD